MPFWNRIFGRSQPTTQHEPGSDIAGVKVLLYLNPPAVKKMEVDGIEWQLVVCKLMAEDGPSEHIQRVSDVKWALSDAAKTWCKNTPIYKDKQGGLCVLFERIDDTHCQKENLTFLGTIEPAGYTAFLGRKFGIKVEDILV